MSNQTDGRSDASAESPMATPRSLKILMLHGYTQNGTLFRAKTRGLEKLLTKAFPAVAGQKSTGAGGSSAQFPGGVQLYYPTGPMHLRPADIPGFDVQAAQGDTESDAWGWWRRETGSGRHVGLQDGLDTIARETRQAGGIDGVIGFSQGAAAAGMVASLLEPERSQAFEKARQADPEALGYPQSWTDMIRETGQEQLKFAVSYSGFYSPNDLCDGFYEPRISTSFCHFIGSLDSVVDESRSLALVDVCSDAKKVYHPGGHFVPAGKEMAGVLIGFIRECLTEKEKEESVEDMDVPF